MADGAMIFQSVVGAIRRHRGLLLPIGAAGLIFVILVPLPAGLVDVLLAANITLAALVLLTAIYTPSPLEFSVFPSVLLGATLFRLVLNVATTRLILTAGDGGSGPAEAQTAAGEVIWAFSEFVTRGSLTVGVILFAIIVVIQFVVVTKGAARISEVAARFVLDAMPGKQMAIDADLAAGLVSEQQARQRRRRIEREADLYGAMDGASKFLRGDAVAAVLITVINILGGLFVGMVHYGWDLSQTASLFTRLTIGDGLVTQVPAFLISISAALIVTRSTARTNLGEEIISQLVARPIVLVITAVFLALLALTSLPKLPLLTLGAGCMILAWVLSRQEAGPDSAAAAPPEEEDAEPRTAAHAEAEHVESLLSVDPMRVELGYALVGLVDPQQEGDLLQRITALRRQMAMELGLVVPPIRIRDNLGLDARSYVVKIRGAKVAAGRLYPKQLLAVVGEKTVGKLLGREATEPAFGTPAVWISPSQRPQAERMNYTVVDPTSVIATHLAEVIRSNAAMLLSRQRVVRLLEKLRATAGSLVEEVTGKLNVGQIRKVLQKLLIERVAIRDMEAILEALCEASHATDDVDLLSEFVRQRMATALTQQYADEDGKLWCVSLAPALEETIHDQLALTGPASGPMPPELGRKVAAAVDKAFEGLRGRGRAPILVCRSEIRPAVRQLVAASQPRAAVLAYNEISSAELQSLESVGIES